MISSDRIGLGAMQANTVLYSPKVDYNVVLVKVVDSPRTQLLVSPNQVDLRTINHSGQTTPLHPFFEMQGISFLLCVLTLLLGVILYCCCDF